MQQPEKLFNYSTSFFAKTWTSSTFSSYFPVMFCHKKYIAGHFICIGLEHRKALSLNWSFAQTTLNKARSAIFQSSPNNGLEYSHIRWQKPAEFFTSSNSLAYIRLLLESWNSFYTKLIAFHSLWVPSGDGRFISIDLVAVINLFGPKFDHWRTQKRWHRVPIIFSSLLRFRIKIILSSVFFLEEIFQIVEDLLFIFQ